jgi:hypothetical protein
MADGTVERTCDILAAVMCGRQFDRRSLAKAYGIRLAAADRYIRAVGAVPGVALVKTGKTLTVHFSWSNALRRGTGL